MSKKYTTSDIATSLNVSIRTAQRYVKDLVNIDNSFNEDVFNLIIERHQHDEETTDSDELIQEGFTQNEYDTFKKWLTEYPLLNNHIEDLRKEIEYHKTKYNDLMRLHEQFILLQSKIADTTQQRNFIEAKDKNIE